MTLPASPSIRTGRRGPGRRARPPYRGGWNNVIGLSTSSPGSRARRGRPPNAEARRTQARLLDAALELFARQGYAATSVREIADAVGVRDSAIYAHSESKRDIYQQLVDEAGPEVLRRVGVDPDQLGRRGATRRAGPSRGGPRRGMGRPADPVGHERPHPREPGRHR